MDHLPGELKAFEDILAFKARLLALQGDRQNLDHAIGYPDRVVVMSLEPLVQQAELVEHMGENLGERLGSLRIHLSKKLLCI